MVKDTTNKIKYLAMVTMQALAMATVSSQASAINTVEVTCNVEDSVPTVVAILSTQQQSVTKHYKNSQTTAILSFLPDYFSAESALANCQTTAKSLNNYYNSNQMNYLASDAIDGKSVVCAVQRRGVGCDSYGSEVLFASHQQVSPSKLLYDMLGDDFKGSHLPSSRTVSRIYTDLRPTWWPF